MQRNRFALLIVLPLALRAFGGDEPAPKKPEAEAAAEAKTPVPDFTLRGADGKEYKLSEFKGKILVLEWTNHGCPYVKKHYDKGHMQKLQQKCAGKGVVWIQICSSAKGKQGHMEAEEWKKLNEEKGVKALTLLDPDGKVGRLYGAKVTPHLWVIDKEFVKAYEGAIDDNRDPRADPAESKNYVSLAVDALLEGKKPEVASTVPYG